MTAFADALAAEAPAHRTLLVDTILDQLDSDIRAEAVTALKDPALSSRLLANVFGRLGHPISEGAVYKWRQRNA